MKTKKWNTFFPRIQVKTKNKNKKYKKGLHQKWNAFFPPNSGKDLRLDAHQSQIIGGDADEDHTQVIGGDTVKLFGKYIPPGFRHPWLYAIDCLQQ